MPFAPVVRSLACALAVLCASALAPLPASAAPAAVSVFPVPGARFASPSTQIAFRGISPSQVGQAAVVVHGSRSGYHSGKVVGDSDGQGASFLPARQFAPGEVVSVTTTGLNVLGAKGTSFQFTVATPAGAIPHTPLPAPTRVRGDVYRFRSRPDLPVAVVKIIKRAPRRTRGDIFIAPQNGPYLNGPMIVDAGGGLVWFKRVPARDTVTDFRVQTYLGKPVLTWWQGLLGAGVGVGEDIISDASYRVIRTVRAANGLPADLHEFELTGHGSALVTAYYPVSVDASSVHGSKHEIVLDSVVQEIDIPTGLVLFQWDSLDHVPFAESQLPPPKKRGAPFDYFHVNSIQEQSDGNVLISARNTWAAYMVDIHSGAVLWRLGGKRSSFRISRNDSFAFQHDVRMRSSSLVSIFDDGAGPPIIHRQSRGLQLRLNFAQKTATRTAQYEHGPPLLANFEGNVQQLPGGDSFVGWGQQPYFTQFDARGRQIFDGRFVDTNSSYRAFRFIWNAKPPGSPAVAATGGRHATAYASWNGSTNVAVWKALGGANPRQLRFLGAARRRGFETAIPIRAQRYVAMLAIDRFGHRLGSSATVRVR